MRLGFIGTGVITDAIVTGLLGSGFDMTKVYLSERNRDISARLARASDTVRICSDNQEIVDRADLVFLAVRPQQAHAVLSPLRFAEQKHVCSLIATIQRETLQNMIGGSTRIFRAIPLPRVANRCGVTAIYPYDRLGEALFAELGQVVTARSLDEFDAYAAASALMGTYFGILETAHHWLVGQGIEGASAKDYLNGVFLGLAQTSSGSRSKTFATLSHEHSTPGGLNAQMQDVFVSMGGAEALTKALDSVAARIQAARDKTM